MICQELYKMATISAHPCFIAVIHLVARSSLISASNPSCFCCCLRWGEGVGESYGNLFARSEFQYIGEKLYLSDFIFKKSDSVSDYLLSNPTYFLFRFMSNYHTLLLPETLWFECTDIKLSNPTYRFWGTDQIARTGR